MREKERKRERKKEAEKIAHISNCFPIVSLDVMPYLPEKNDEGIW